MRAERLVRARSPGAKTKATKQAPKRPMPLSKEVIEQRLEAAQGSPNATPILPLARSNAWRALPVPLHCAIADNMLAAPPLASQGARARAPPSTLR